MTRWSISQCHWNFYVIKWHFLFCYTPLFIIAVVSNPIANRWSKISITLSSYQLLLFIQFSTNTLMILNISASTDELIEIIRLTELKERLITYSGWCKPLIADWCRLLAVMLQDDWSRIIDGYFPNNWWIDLKIVHFQFWKWNTFSFENGMKAIILF